MIEHLAALPAWLVVTVIGVSIAVESGFLLGLVLPGTTAVIGMGVMIGLGVVPAVVGYAVAIGAAVAGPSIGWLVGRRGGPAVRSSALGARIPARSWETADRVVVQRGRLAVAFAQFVVGARTLVPLLVGMAGGSYRSFAVISVPSACVWSGSLTLAGQLAGASYAVLTRTLGNATVSLAVMVLVLAVLTLAGRLTALRLTGSSPVRTRASRVLSRLGPLRTVVAPGPSASSRRAWASVVVWWLAAVLLGLATSAVMVWAVRHSDLDAFDPGVAAWIAAHSPAWVRTAAEVVVVVFIPTTVLLCTYAATALFLVRTRNERDAYRRRRAVTVSLGLAALALASQATAGAIQRATQDGSSTGTWDLQFAVVPCALAVAVIVLSPPDRRDIRAGAWTAAAALIALITASRLVMGHMTISQAMTSLVVAGAWTLLLVNALTTPVAALEHSDEADVPSSSV